MREIKFRGREESGHWCYGDVTFTESKERAHIRIRAAGYYPNVEVTPATVGQYTELKDSEGRDIYEGDVIKTHEGDVGVIAWETELGGFRARLTDDSFYTLTALFASMFAVIGNVYDNPELLEAHE